MNWFERNAAVGWAIATILVLILLIVLVTSNVEVALEQSLTPAQIANITSNDIVTNV